MYGVQFGMDGLSLDGTTWYNPKTNDVVHIKSNFFEDNVMKLQTTSGRMMTLGQLEQYVQWTGQGEPPTTKNESESKQNDLPPEVASLLAPTDKIGDNSEEYPNGDILPEDLELISGGEKRSAQGHYLQPTAMINPHNIRLTKTSNYDIIDRALNKTKDPDWNLVMKWPKFPQKELDMLTTVMDIPLNEVTDYYIDKIQSELDALMLNIKDQLCDYIDNKLNPKSDPEIPKKVIKKKNVKATT